MDTRRLVLRTDQVLADPRLTAAERRLGRALVKAAVGAPSSGPGTVRSPRTRSRTRRSRNSRPA